MGRLPRATTRSRRASTSRQLLDRASRRTPSRRWPRATANYANSQLIKMEAIADGYAEGIALDTQGYLSEGSGQNLFLVRDGVIYTPPLDRVDPAGHHARHRDHAGARSRVRGARGDAAARDALHRRRGVLRRHAASRSRRSGRSTRSPSATAAAARSPRRCSSGVLRRHQRRSPTHGWLTFVYPGEPRQRLRTPARRRRAAREPAQPRARCGAEADLGPCTSTIC